MEKKKTLVKSSLPAIIAVLLFLLISAGAYLLVPPEDKSQERIVFLTVYSVIAALLILFFINFVLIKLLNAFITWKKYPVARFLLQMILGTVLSLGAINLIYQSVKFEFTDAPPDADQIILMNIYASSILLPVISFYFGFKFLTAWRKSELESEQLQKENTRSQLLTLRNHLDPHFLFNNLNILSSLMDTDIEQSKSYLDKFAEVYRQILKTEYSDLTTLSDEMKLIDSYIYLLKTRFRDKVFYNINIDESSMNKAIPPLTIQMLIENAIKHNMATVERPVTVDIYNDGNVLVVKNNVQKKKYLDQEREASGISNIQKRYAFFTDKEVEVRETGGNFIVRVPLIDIEYD